MIKSIHHEQILQKLLEYKKNSLENFIGRVRKDKKINNGCWFIGNTKYIQTTFWTGKCSKSKIYNISFSIKVIQKKLTPCIEVCCRYIDNIDNIREKQNHRIFFENFTKNLKIQEHKNTNNYWLYTHNCDDFEQGYIHLVRHYKPIIDKLIIGNPIDIRSIDDETHDKFKTLISNDRLRLYGLATV